MGIAFFDEFGKRIIVRSVFHFYGDSANTDWAISIANDVASYWNGPEAVINFKQNNYPVFFNIEGYYRPDLTHSEVLENTDPVNNYFRIEEYCNIDISFVDGLNSNTGYFKLGNLQHTGSTAAHEYGHTLGLDHPDELNIIGQGTPGIMYPRGTLVDAAFQYNPEAEPGVTGGTMNPIHRKVSMDDIADLNIAEKLMKGKGKAVLGGFSSVWHEKH